MKNKKFSFVAKDCNVIIIASNKKEAIEKIRACGAAGADKANSKNVFLYN